MARKNGTARSLQGKKTVDVTRVSETFLESQTVDCGKTKPRTEMRETRQQVRLRHPVTLLLVRCVGRGVSAGGHSRPGAMAREGASRRSRRARARAKERARLDPSASSLRVDVEGFERNIVASTSSTRVWSFACEGAGETRGTRTAVAAEGDRAYGILTRSPIQSVRTSPSPVVAPSADILPDASRVPVANEDASLGLAEPHRWRARGGADRESARAPRTPTRSRSLASARARRKCVVLARLRVRGARRPDRERSGEALRRRRQRREFRRHRT
jgi:hypothetical protein